jgi:hypothetical protein
MNRIISYLGTWVCSLMFLFAGRSVRKRERPGILPFLSQGKTGTFRTQSAG